MNFPMLGLKGAFFFFSSNIVSREEGATSMGHDNEYPTMQLLFIPSSYVRITILQLHYWNIVPNTKCNQTMSYIEIFLSLCDLGLYCLKLLFLFTRWKKRRARVGDSHLELYEDQVNVKRYSLPLTQIRSRLKH